jgi:hypothetical protein
MKLLELIQPNGTRLRCPRTQPSDARVDEEETVVRRRHISVERKRTWLRHNIELVRAVLRRVLPFLRPFLVVLYCRHSCEVRGSGLHRPNAPLAAMCAR